MCPSFLRLISVCLLITAAVATPAHAAETTLITRGAIWKYLDNGTDQGTAWRQIAFDDSAWRSGPAELGYGDGDEATVVGYGPDSARKYITTYFRHTFDVANPAQFSALILRLVRDDGAVVHLNGTEVWRSNITSSSPITHTTLAYNVGTSTEERAWMTKSIAASALRAGTNVVAVELHQSEASSSDISFNFELAGDTTAPAPVLTRGPYLQLGTPTSITVRWRTDNPSDSRVRYGARPGSLTLQADAATQTTEHAVTLAGLTPGTRYYYSVGSSTKVLSGDDNAHTFLTSPNPGTAAPARVWVLGDAGTGGTGALSVRNAYYNYAGTNTTNFWLLLGDNAYSSGTEEDYESGIFKMYPELLRSSVVWPSLGNHDTAESFTHSLAYPYYGIFDVPTHGEAGGLASGTESYYSFDYGNVHFIALDSQTSDRSPTGPMLTWLKNDLASNLQHWTIAFWHHPPYSHGSHNSDVSSQLIAMRQNVLPILEAANVDLVLCGHSHAYERSFLLDGHYGTSSTLNGTMIKDGGNGSATPYRKADAGPHEGTVYVVSGAAGVIVERGALDHPVMVANMYSLGSTILDIAGDRLDVKLLRNDGVIADSFSIVKGPQAPAAPSALNASPQSSTSIALTWADNATDEEGHRVSRCTGASCTDFAEIAQIAADVTSFVDGGLTTNTLYRYRVVAFNAAGTSPFSNVAEATTQTAAVSPAAPANLTAAAAAATRVDLAWSDNATNETGYQIERCSGQSCTNFVQIATTAADIRTYADTTTTKNTHYRYRVRAFNAAGTSAYSNIATERTPSR